MRPAHRENRGTGGVALVEDIDLSLGVTSELERDQAQENRLAGAGRPHDHHMADITDMGGKPERGRACGLRDQQRRSVCLGDLGEMLVAGRPRRSEEHTSELQSLMRISYAVFCLKKKKKST